MGSKRVGVQLGRLKVTYGLCQVFLIVGSARLTNGDHVSGALSFNVACRRVAAWDAMLIAMQSFVIEHGRLGGYLEPDYVSLVIKIIIPIKNSMQEEMAAEALGNYGNAMYQLALQVVRDTAT